MSEYSTAMRLLCKVIGIPEPEAEYQFHPKRKWKADFAWDSLLACTVNKIQDVRYFKIIIEVEGGITSGNKRCPMCKQSKAGGHSSVTGIIRDIEKGNAAQMLGFAYYRVLPEWFDDGRVEKLLREVFGK